MLFSAFQEWRELNDLLTSITLGMIGNASYLHTIPSGDCLNERKKKMERKKATEQTLTVFKKPKQAQKVK